VAAGNVRTHRIADVYRHAPLFQSLHDSGSFKDRCGVCEFHALCGGSRARAFQATGDALGADSLCEFVPRSAAVSVDAE
jgi:radical SAM protein with 4Fe4S-binding SPASM domain